MELWYVGRVGNAEVTLGREFIFLNIITEEECAFLNAQDSTGCIGIDSVLVIVNDIYDVYIPNVFAPNDDGTNDFFILYSICGVEIITKMSVFNRWEIMSLRELI